MILKDYFSKALTTVEKATEAGLIACCIDIENQIVRVMTEEKIVDTGRLRGSITYKVAKSGDKPRSPAEGKDGVQSQPPPGVGYIGTNVAYAAHVEYGTKNMQPRSYLRRGFDERKDKIPEIYKNQFEKTFKKFYL